MDSEDTHMEPDKPEVGDFTGIETPEELRPHEAAQSSADRPPALDRVRPRRAPIIPRSAWIAVGASLASILVTALVVFLVMNSQKVAVPDVKGKDIGVARNNLVQAGLEAEVSEERFSSIPDGEVLSQSPRAGAEIRKGGTVFLIISAGTEEFPMPDLVGNGLVLARGTLESRGLAIEIEEVVSEATSGTVLSTTPAAGAMVRSGDVVRVMIATSKPATTGLEPYDLTGMSVLVDPAPVVTGEPDIPLEVARRLRALFEASGATVTVIRSGVDSATTDAERQRVASETSATVAIGLSVAASGPAGRKVSAPAAASSLQAALVKQLTSSVAPALRESLTKDPVLSSFTGPWSRVTLGSSSQRLDVTAFSDPRWADQVARAVYAAVGEVYGKKEGQ